jgi:hypothetical protein
MQCNAQQCVGLQMSNARGSVLLNLVHQQAPGGCPTTSAAAAIRLFCSV